MSEGRMMRGGRMSGGVGDPRLDDGELFTEGKDRRRFPPSE